MSRAMRLCIPFAIVAAIAGTVGFYAGVLRNNAVTVLPARGLPAFDYFLSNPSFSEVEEAKDMLTSAATRALMDLQTRPGVGALEQGNGKRASESDYSGAIRDVERQIVAFQGTSQELALVAEELRLLLAARRFDRWLDVYLAALYQHPTAQIVSRFATQAGRAGRITGRQDEVQKAFQHRSSIPSDFATDLTVSPLETKAVAARKSPNRAM